MCRIHINIIKCVIVCRFRHRDRGQDLPRDHRQRYRYHRTHAQNVPAPVLCLTYRSLVSVSNIMRECVSTRDHDSSCSYLFINIYRKCRADESLQVQEARTPVLCSEISDKRISWWKFHGTGIDQQE